MLFIGIICYTKLKFILLFNELTFNKSFLKNSSKK